MNLNLNIHCWSHTAS